MRPGVVSVAAAVLAGGLAWATPAGADLWSPNPYNSAFFSRTPIVQANFSASAGWLSYADGALYPIEGTGRVNFPFATVWNIQWDGFWNELGGNVFGAHAYEAGGLVHVFRRDPEQYAVGIFGGYSSWNGSGTYTVGAEAQGYWGPNTVYGQAAYRMIDAPGGSIEVVQVRGALRQYFGENNKLEGNLMWTRFGSSSILTASVIAESRGDSALAAFAGVRYDNWENISIYRHVWTVFVGLRSYFGSRTIMDNDRNGPAMDFLVAHPVD